jgi:hypothetical protein
MSRASLALVGSLCASVLIGISSVALRAEESAKADESAGKTVELCNGKDLTGWCYKTKAGDTIKKFDGMTETDDKVYSVKDDEIVVHDQPGTAILWTVAEFNTDFELRFEFRAGVNADSGVFLRKPQLQVRDYLVAGPYKDLKKYKPQEWNEVVVIVKGEIMTATCNGEELKVDKAKVKVPPTGGIGLESDRGVMEYRHLKVTEIKK